MANGLETEILRKGDKLDIINWSYILVNGTVLASLYQKPSNQDGILSG